MSKQAPYPSYITYEKINRTPSVLDQQFPKASDVEQGKLFYPKAEKLEKLFSSEYDSLKFGTARFCGFLHDTIAVELNIVIPAVSEIDRLNLEVPDIALDDISCTGTDEGHHADQSRVFLNSIKKSYKIEYMEKGEETPIFLRRLEKLKSAISNPYDKALFTVINGVVTETRISVELSQFASNKTLVPEVRAVCRSHQEDEAIHSSQFRALGQWIWSKLDDEKKELAATFYAKSTIARSLPDRRRIGFYLSQVTNIERQDCDKIVEDIYTEKVLRDDMLFAARPTLRYLQRIGVTEYKNFKRIFANIGVEL